MRGKARGLYRVQNRVEGRNSVEAGIASVVSIESRPVTRGEERKRGKPADVRAPIVSEAEERRGVLRATH